MSDHREIYLQPKCCVNENYGRLWCQSPNPDDSEGPEWTAYIIKSEFDQLQAENAKLKAELEELKILHADSTNLVLSQMYAGARKEIEELKAEAARLSEPDMFWDYHSAETDYESADELASECADEHLSLGESMTITVQLAKKLQNRQMRVTAPLSCDGECAWEWIKPNGEQQ